LRCGGPAEHTAALQGEQQGEGGDDEDDGGGGHDDQCDERGMRGAGAGQRQAKADPLSGMTGPILDRNKLHRNTPAVRLADSNQKSRRNSHIRSFPSARSEHI
jgi:hypothetical protein